ncbi:MAG: 5'/3'-nucleotidase SurE [Proteobacteria bacterium]|nr:5'/3'-nucleotidase SurE [Pseudomonadota bacterium]
MIKRPFILVTNDDGVYAPGIKHLWQVLSKVADICVVAPASEQSAVSLSITVRHPLRIEKIEWPFIEAEVWTVNGTPADCVKLALNVILPRAPQLIVSGINRGNNAGRNVLYSGTVAAVIEGVMHNIPGIAFSVSDYFNPDYEKVKHYIPSVIHYLLSHPLPEGTFLNVNFPKHTETGIKGIRFTKQGKEYWTENPEQREHPAEGSPYYWLGSKLAQFDEDDDSDIVLLKEGYATAVPIHIGDLTHHTSIKECRKTFENFVNKPLA